MQLLPRYLCNNITTLVADVAGFITEYRPVYNRGIEVYKGIDNALQFRLLNADQKPVNVATGYTPKFEAYDETGRLLITRDCTIQDDGSTITRGKFKLTISENDLKNVKQQFLSYIVYLVETDGDKVLTYSQSNFKNNGTIFVNAKALPPKVAATEVTVPPPAAELTVIVLPTVAKVILVPPTKFKAPTKVLNEVTPAAPPPPAPI
jgi:hypothetical protein